MALSQWCSLRCADVCFLWVHKLQQRLLSIHDKHATFTLSRSLYVERTDKVVGHYWYFSWVLWNDLPYSALVNTRSKLRFVKWFQRMLFWTCCIGDCRFCFCVLDETCKRHPLYSLTFLLHAGNKLSQLNLGFHFSKLESHPLLHRAILVVDCSCGSYFWRTNFNHKVYAVQHRWFSAAHSLPAHTIRLLPWLDGGRIIVLGVRAGWSRYNLSN